MIITRVLLTLILLVTIGFAEEERQVIARSDPEYPEIAKRMQLHGTVKLKLWIAAAGNVSRVEYIGGHPILAESAMAAVKKWKFESAPKETTQVVALKF